jgi:hypothetical protein
MDGARAGSKVICSSCPSKSQIPGDVPDLYSFVLGFTDHAIGALTSCDVVHWPDDGSLH